MGTVDPTNRRLVRRSNFAEDVCEMVRLLTYGRPGKEGCGV